MKVLSDVRSILKTTQRICVEYISCARIKLFVVTCPQVIFLFTPHVLEAREGRLS